MVGWGGVEWWWFRPVLGFSFSQAEQNCVTKLQTKQQNIQSIRNGLCRLILGQTQGVVNRYTKCLPVDLQEPKKVQSHI